MNAIRCRTFVFSISIYIFRVCSTYIIIIIFIFEFFAMCNGNNFRYCWIYQMRFVISFPRVCVMWIAIAWFAHFLILSASNISFSLRFVSLYIFYLLCVLFFRRSMIYAANRSQPLIIYRRLCLPRFVKQCFEIVYHM